MPIQINDQGSGNSVILPKNADEIDLTVTFRGDNNRIQLAHRIYSQGATIDVGSGNSINIGEFCKLSKIAVFANDQASIEIGSRCAFTWEASLFCHEPSHIRIGEGCLFANGVFLSTSDMHSIVDLKTRKRINPARDIVIGNRVWLGQDVIVLKGGDVGTGTIIGARAIVSGPIPECVSAAGTPAKVIRTGVTWEHALLP